MRPGGLMFFHRIVPRSRWPYLSLRQPAMVLLCLCITGASTQDGKINCTVPSVKPLKEAVFMCHFPEDLSVTKKDFTVYHYAKDGSPDAVINCWWLSNKLDCYAQPGIQYSKTVGTNLTVTIREVTSKLTGTYACQVAGYGRTSLETCELKFELGSSDTCSIAHNRSESHASLTCFFNEDVAKTGRKFAVYKHSREDKYIVANCSWEDARHKCQMEYGYLNSDDVSYYTTVRILDVAEDKWGNYSCWHEGSTSGQQQTCQLDVDENVPEERDTKVEKTDNTLAIAVGLVISALLLAAGIVLVMVFKGKIPFLPRLIGPRDEEPDGEESQPMTTLHDGAVKEMTNKFVQRLADDVKEMYPDILDTCYFVPPVYFNKTRYITHSVSGEVVYSTIIPDMKNAKEMSVVRHDRAMQHVLYCLHHMADQGQEKMFVLTQFNYDDYLNNPGADFTQHCLPVPSGLVQEDKDIACFDFLIVHREHGVLVGVVKAVSEEVEESNDGEQEAGGSIVSAVTEAVEQLQKANRMIRHLMSDQQYFPRVRQTLILPNLTRASLCRAVARHNDLVERLRECLDVRAIEDPTKQCLCVEDLSKPSTPWYVTPHVVNTLRDRWKWTCTRVDKNDIMKDDLYLSVIARFCGPATQSTLDTQDEPYLLPKTLAEAVSLTGDLYERFTLHPDMIEILNEKRLFLIGPPTDDKMRMLTLAGKTWLSQGHQVFILSGSSEPRDSVMSMFCNKLKTDGEPNEASDSSRDRLRLVQCDLKNRNQVEETLNKLNIKEGSELCVIVEETVVKGKHFRSFCDTLISRWPDAYFWATSNTNENVPKEWKHQTFDQVLTCPPAVVREVTSVAISKVTPSGERKPTCLPPTDGLPVKYFYHKKSALYIVHDCTECSKQAVDFLIKHLFTRNVTGAPSNDVSARTSTSVTPGQTNSTAFKRASILQHRDVLILFESEIEKIKQFLKGLKERGIKVSTLQDVNGKYKFTGENDSVRAMHVKQLDLYKPRKKVVVYVEKHSSLKDVSKKRLAIRTCTSQLIVIRGNT